MFAGREMSSIIIDSPLCPIKLKKKPADPLDPDSKPVIN
jgi:hypothetical protein